MEKRPINKQFGKKIRALFELIENTENWEQYVTDETAEVVKYVYDVQSIKIAESGLNMLGVTIRAHLLRALDRITDKNTEFKHGGKSELAQELFNLMDTVPNWEKYVTEYEALLAKTFREVRNFYKLAEVLGLNKVNAEGKVISGAGNIAGTLYGTTQKMGVIGKIKEGKPQSERRDFSIFEDNHKSNKSEQEIDEIN
jgi:hypothetical protein